MHVGAPSQPQLIPVAGRIPCLVVVVGGGGEVLVFSFCWPSSIKEWINKSRHVRTAAYSSAIKAAND